MASIVSVLGRYRRFQARIRPLRNFLLKSNYGRGSHVRHQRRLRINLAAQTGHSGLAARLWAQRKIDELMLIAPSQDDEHTNQQVAEIGRHFGIVTPNTSFIVLEELDQYLRYKIEPPASLPQIREEYLEQMELMKGYIESIEEDKMLRVTDLIKRRIAWWNEDSTSPEANEYNVMHCFDFGKGVDKTLQEMFTSVGSVELPLLSEVGLVYGDKPEQSDKVESKVPKSKIAASVPLGSQDQTLNEILGALEKKHKEYDDLRESEAAIWKKPIGRVKPPFDRETLLKLQPIMWQTKEEYDDSGPSIVHRKCFGGGEASGSPLTFGFSAEASKSTKSAPSAAVAAPEAVRPKDGQAKPVDVYLDYGYASTVSGGQPGEVEHSEDSAVELQGYDESLSVASGDIDHAQWELGQADLAELGKWQIISHQLSTVTTYRSTFTKASDSLELEYKRLKFAKENQSNPKFFVDTAITLIGNTKDKITDARSHQANLRMAFRILSNLAEIEFDNVQWLRILSFRLQASLSELPQLAIAKLVTTLNRKILKLRSEEPQAYRDLANSLVAYSVLLVKRVENAKPGALTDPGPEIQRILHVVAQLLEEAAKLFKVVLTKTWDVRFDQIECVVFSDINRLFQFAQSINMANAVLSHLDARMLRNMPIDLRVEIQWDTDQTDVALTVTEPSGSVCSSFMNKTKSGGFMTRNFTKGLGPVEYVCRNVSSGTFTINATLFHSPNYSSGTTVCVNIWTKYGNVSVAGGGSVSVDSMERHKCIVARLEKSKATEPIAFVSIDL